MTKEQKIDEARTFFLSNSSGSFKAINSSDEEKDCDTFPEACAWINDNK